MNLFVICIVAKYLIQPYSSYYWSVVIVVGVTVCVLLYVSIFVIRRHKDLCCRVNVTTVNVTTINVTTVNVTTINVTTVNVTTINVTTVNVTTINASGKC